MGYLALVAFVVAFAAIYINIELTRRRVGPLRRAITARDATFRMRLDRVRMMGTGGLFGGTRGCWIDQNGPMSVIVHGDAFEVSCTLAALRAAFGMEYYFEARETTVGVSRLRSPIYRSDWIVVTGQQTGREIQLAIMKKNGHELHAIWSALVGAGAVPVGAPPQAGLVAARG